MASLADFSWIDPNPAHYTSNGLRLFFESLEGRNEVQVLDVGPVCSDNINFLAKRVKRLYICDLFLRLDQYRRQGLPLSRVLRDLDYPPQSFDGILLWELTDHLDDREIDMLARKCHLMVKRRGIVMTIAQGEHAVSSVSSFVIRDAYRLHLRPQPQLELPLHIRQNRAVLGMLAPFIPLKSFIYRNGFREFLFKRS